MPFNTHPNSASMASRSTNTSGVAEVYSGSSGLIFPTIGGDFYYNQRGRSGIYNGSRLAKGHITSTNCVLAGNDV